MFKDKFVFSQLTVFLDRNHFNYLARKYGGDKYVKHLTCWNQLLALMFGQLSNRESLRDLIVALEAHQSKCFHLGLGRKPIAKTTLATANQNRDYRIFEEFAFYMMEQARKKRAADIFKLGGKVYAFDSTTIPLCLSVFWWAKFRKKKGGVKAPSSMTWRHRCLPSIISPQPLSTTPRQYQKSLMKQVLTMCLTEATTTLENYTAYSGWSPSSLSEPRATCSTGVSGGNGGCQRTYSLMQRLN